MKATDPAFVDATCSHAQCRTKGTYHLSGHCTNCGTKPIIAAFTAGHEAGTDVLCPVECPACGCRRLRWSGPATTTESSSTSRGYIYVASSWRNQMQPIVVAALREANFTVYDFKNPPTATAFAWTDIGLDHSNPRDGDPLAPDLSTRADFLSALTHPRAAAGFESDFTAMARADAIIAVTPCGKSAHTELGWGAGAGKHTAVLLDDPCTPELMYLMVDHLATDISSLMGWLDATLPTQAAA